MALVIAGLVATLIGVWPGLGGSRAGAAPRASEPSPGQTLCVLDFNRLGDDGTMDWLQQGLADMMIGTLNRLTQYRVVERKYLREILREHGLATSGLVDMSTAVRGARLARAQLLLLGNFVRQEDRLTVRVRLIRLADQQVLALAVWTDRPSRVLGAPRALSERLLADLKNPIDPAQRAGLVSEIPRTIDVARAYYEGIGAFDDGRYAEALAHYLDAARHAGDFTKVYPAALEMYYLLGQGEHAVLLARQLAQSSEAAGDIPNALEYHFAAAQHCLDPLDNQRCAVESLERLLGLVKHHDGQTGEIARTKARILTRIDELQATGKYATFGKLLAERSIRYLVWTGAIDAELTRRAEEQARGGLTELRGGIWVKRPVPRPSVLMWKIRAQRALAHAQARQGAIERALDQYQELLEEYGFLSRHPRSDGAQRDAIRAEAHFMVLHHHARTGQLIRDHPVIGINRLNTVGDGLVFTRDFRDRDPDRRARVASRYEDRGYEYFDFVAPPGQQIDAVTLRTEVAGIAAFGVNLPRAAGWPPKFSLSQRLTELRVSTRGRYERRVALPPGTEFVSLATSWGPGLYENTREVVLHHQRFGPKAGPDIEWWEAAFVVSRKAATTVTTTAAAAPERLERYAAGWEQATVIRSPQTTVYTGQPALDVYAEDWHVHAADGNIQIFHRRDPQLRIALPIRINTPEPEFDPSLVRTHDGGWALLWARGTSARTARRFVALSRDLLRWETPQRMVFAEPPGKLEYTYAQVEPLERTTNVVPVQRSYVMLLAQGFLRSSTDLRTWGPPQKVLSQDLDRNRLLKTRDGTVWAVYESSSEERQPYTPDDWLHGSYVVDGRQYRHVTELRVSRSRDGVHWQGAGTLVFPGRPSGLWGFALSERQIGVALAFNNRVLKWMTASTARDLRAIDAEVPAVHHDAAAEFFVRNAALVCVRPVPDLQAQTTMVLATSSRALYERLAE
jgi:TolB-like protein